METSDRSIFILQRRVKTAINLHTYFIPSLTYSTLCKSWSNVIIHYHNLCSDSLQVSPCSYGCIEQKCKSKFPNYLHVPDYPSNPSIQNPGKQGNCHHEAIVGCLNSRSATLGKLCIFLGWGLINWMRAALQSQHIRHILERFRMSNSKPCIHAPWGQEHGLSN